MREKVENIYNVLFKFEAGNKNSLYPIHKKLQFENSPTFQSFNDISDWIAANISLSKTATILDAGCGVGYVLLKLCEAYDCKGLGISLSRHEIKAAKTNAIEKELENNCTFRVQNFDDLQKETFDLIIAIESLKHASNVEFTLKKLQQNLKPGGQIIIVEDFLSTAYTKHKFTAAFSNAWNVPTVYTETQFKGFCKQAKLSLVESINLSSFIPKKNRMLTRLKLWMVQFGGYLVRHPDKKTKLNIYKGALIMDYFYAKHIFEYKAKVFKKSNS